MMDLFKNFDPKLPACDTAIQAVTGGTLTPERRGYLESLVAKIDTKAVLANLLARKGNE